MRAFRTHELEGAPRARPKHLNPLAVSPHSISSRLLLLELSALKSINSPTRRIFFNPTNYLTIHRPIFTSFNQFHPSSNYSIILPRSIHTTFRPSHPPCPVALISPRQAPRPVRLTRDLASSLRKGQPFALDRVGMRFQLQ